MGESSWMDWSQWDRKALSYSAFTCIQYYDIVIEVFTPLPFLKWKLICFRPSAWWGEHYWTSGICVRVWGPPAASSERCGSTGRWRLHAPVWHYYRTGVFQLEDEKRLSHQTLRTKSWIPRGQLEQLLRLSQCSRFSFLLLLFGGICSLRLSDSTFLSLRGHKRPQISLWRIYFVYRDIGLVLNNLKMYVFFILYTFFFSVGYLLCIWASVIALRLCI